MAWSNCLHASFVPCPERNRKMWWNVITSVLPRSLTTINGPNLYPSIHARFGFVNKHPLENHCGAAWTAQTRRLLSHPSKIRKNLHSSALFETRYVRPATADLSGEPDMRCARPVTVKPSSKTLPENLSTVTRIIMPLSSPVKPEEFAR